MKVCNDYELKFTDFFISLEVFILESKFLIQVLIFGIFETTQFNLHLLKHFDIFQKNKWNASFLFCNNF